MYIVSSAEKNTPGVQDANFRNVRYASAGSAEIVLTRVVTSYDQSGRSMISFDSNSAAAER